MVRLAGCILLVTLVTVVVLVGCMPSLDSTKSTTGTSRDNSVKRTDQAVIFLTGNTHSTLQPCGCSADQLGGFDRRGAVINSVSPDRRVVVDTGNLLAGTSMQDIIKLQIMFQAIPMLDYDVVNLNREELQLAAEMGLIEQSSFKIISSSSSVERAPVVDQLWSKKVKLGRLDAVVNIMAIDDRTRNIEALAPRLTEGRCVNIAIADQCSTDLLDRISGLGLIDVVICPTDADEPRIVDPRRTRPQVISVGRLGKYVAKLVLDPKTDGGVGVRFEGVVINSKLKQDQNLVDLYKDYQLIVKEERLLEQIAKVPLPGNLEYVGSENCHSCHGYEHDAWAKKKHAHAYDTLVKVGSQYDPECVGCHVVGFGYDSGFASEKSPKDLRNVGCEVCHGPGSDHFKAVTTGRTDMGISDVQTPCNECHTTDRSPGFAGHEEEYLQKIIHWREPNALNTVKK